MHVWISLDDLTYVHGLLRLSMTSVDAYERAYACATFRTQHSKHQKLRLEKLRKSPVR
jgi:hypothetical protein